MIKRRARALRVDNIERIVQIITSGGILAYPTETVWGLGCDIINTDAAKRLRAIKRRAAATGFILIAGSWRQFSPFLPDLSADEINKICSPRARPVSWVVEDRRGLISPLVKGKNTCVALRLSLHPVVLRITARLGRPILSTSANLAGMRPARTAAEVDRYFGTRIDGLVRGTCGSVPLPSQLHELNSGRVLRR